MRISVNGGKFKRVIKFIGTLIRRTELSRSMLLEICDNKLYLTFSAGYSYSSSIEIISDKSMLVEANCTVYYHDISEYISGKEEITLEFLPNGVFICSDMLEVTLYKSDSVVNRISTENISEYKTLDQGKVVSVLNLLTSTDAVSRTLKTTKPITIYNNVARIDYATTIFECELLFPNCTLNYNVAKLIASFAPSYYKLSTDTIIFFNRDFSENLIIAWSKPSKQEDFTNIELVAKFTAGKELPKIKNNICTFLVFKEGYQVNIEDSSGASISISNNANSSVVVSLSLPLEYLNLFLKLLKDDIIEVWKGEEVICFKGKILNIMTSY